MKKLFVTTAIVEVATGVSLMASPVTSISQLVGSPLDSPGGLVIARVAGAALMSLGIACWLMRTEGVTRASKRLVTAMLIYNVTVAAVFVYSAQSLKLPDSGLWPAVALHVTLAVWCAVCLSRQPISHSGAGTSD